MVILGTIHTTVSFAIPIGSRKLSNILSGLQYADGVAAPFLIHGPTSGDYDVAFDPIIIADWVHDTSFNVFQQELEFHLPQTDTIVVDGLGRGFFLLPHGLC
jgi:FtsP/CotA-like multicopper oxidase with cupredoxin domain